LYHSFFMKYFSIRSHSFRISPMSLI
jgi:hypothetical protein